ncbi:MAG TPA: hypothetical protein VHY58_10040 [Streptosporangiaceae bacterium]|jgi:hypothetical protein|nr:hypothetical protein [Streptosporangiaceae bacterium]
MTSGEQPGQAAAPDHPAVLDTAGLLHHRRGWIWTLAVSLVGFIVAAAAGAKPTTGGTASFLLDLVALLMLIVFVVALVMILVITARLRQRAPQVRGSALAVHRAARHPVLAHPHDRRRHPYGYVFGLVLLAGWMVGAVVFVPRLVDSVAYLAGAGSSATFVPGSYFQQCTSRAGCSTGTNGVLEVNGHPSAATWPAQVPLNVPFRVREPVWRWALGSGLINGYGTAIGSLFVGLLFEGGALLAAFIILRPVFGRLRRRRHRPAAGAATLVRH